MIADWTLSPERVVKDIGERDDGAERFFRRLAEVILCENSRDVARRFYETRFEDCRSVVIGELMKERIAENQQDGGGDKKGSVFADGVLTHNAPIGKV